MQISPKNVWGKVVLFLKEHRQVALHVACGDITDVEIQDNKLVVKVYDGMLIQMLNDGKREIENALKWQGLDFSLEVQLLVQEKEPFEKDLEKLQQFGETNIKLK